MPMRQVIDEGHLFCVPGCAHRLAIYRPGGFQPRTRNVWSGRPNLCAVVLTGTDRAGRDEYLTACGEIVGTASISHRTPNCTKCRQALRDAGVDFDLDP